MSVQLMRAKLRASSRSPAVRSGFLYLFVAPISSVVSTLIGSTSEYRFPHSLATTTLHLFISLISLLLVQSLLVILRRRLNRRHVNRRQLSSVEPYNPDQTSSSRSLQSYLTPTNLASTLLSTLSSFIQSQSYHTVHHSSSGNTFPTPILITISTFKDFSNLLGVANFSLPLTISGLVGFILFLGEGLRSWSDESAMEAFSRLSLKISYAFGVLGWVLALKMGFKEGPSSNHSPPTVIYHLTSSLTLFLPALVLSGELSNIYRSGHFGFFTELGFWMQEIVMAWCGLLNLLAFWNMVQHVNPQTVFALVGLKDRYLPHFYSFLFGNPAAKVTASSILSPIQQSVVLLAVGVYALLDWGLQGVGIEGIRREENGKGIDSSSRSKAG